VSGGVVGGVLVCGGRVVCVTGAGRLVERLEAGRAAPGGCRMVEGDYGSMFLGAVGRGRGRLVCVMGAGVADGTVGSGQGGWGCLGCLGCRGVPVASEALGGGMEQAVVAAVRRGGDYGSIRAGNNAGAGRLPNG